MESLSVVIITFNEEKNIARCLDSVKTIADEIIVLDSYSTDATVLMARERGAIVHQQPFAGYIAQKNAATQLASHDYILSLDADEALDEKLVRSIQRAKEGFAFRAYKINRCANYCGKFIRHGSWYPEAKIRLFDRRVAEWGGLDPHDVVKLNSNQAVSHLDGDILHYICRSIEEHVQRSNNFSSIAARSLYKAGYRPNLFKIVSSPTWFFIKDYLLRAGFLNGYYGWVIAKTQSRYHFQKYLKLYRMYRSKD